MAEKSHEGLKWVMRAGYGARGAIYVLVGILAFWAALLAACQAQAAPGPSATDEPAPPGEPWIMPSTADVQEATREPRAAAVRGCGQEGTGLVVDVELTFGPDGTLRAARALGHLEPEVRRCIEDAFEDARVPAFRGPVFETTVEVSFGSLL